MRLSMGENRPYSLPSLILGTGLFESSLIQGPMTSSNNVKPIDSFPAAFDLCSYA